VQAVRPGGATVRGADAACVNCHRRSGLGSSEGQITIPPIAGPYLFVPRGRSLEQLGVPFVDTVRINHDPYTDESLGRAIREGIAANGRPLNYLMPRYQIDDAAMAKLVAYLKDMKVVPSQGVSAAALNFATIITPDADPVKRRGMLDVMNQYFVDKNNAVARTKAPTLYSSHTMMFRVERRWQLHVWQLSGKPATWEPQLRQYLASQPVFAVISGLGGSDWEPVHRFCEAQALPCLFPNVEAPVGHDTDFYSVDFSRGVLLEAQLIARELADAREPIHRLVQVFRAGDVGEQAARTLQAAHMDSAPQIVNRVLNAHAASKDLAAALREVGPTDALVLWLRPQDLKALATVPVTTSRVWMSGEMGGLEQAPLPASWRVVARMAYPVDLPGQRVVRVDSCSPATTRARPLPRGSASRPRAATSCASPIRRGPRSRRSGSGSRRSEDLGRQGWRRGGLVGVSGAPAPSLGTRPDAWLRASAWGRGSVRSRLPYFPVCATRLVSPNRNLPRIRVE
jgi:hypothetical protein